MHGNFQTGCAGAAMAIAACVSGAIISASAQAQIYPARPVRIITAP